jgi:hypothetical protein
MILCVRDKGDILLWNAMQQKIKPIARPAPDSSYVCKNKIELKIKV